MMPASYMCMFFCSIYLLPERGRGSRGRRGKRNPLSGIGRCAKLRISDEQNTLHSCTNPCTKRFSTDQSPGDLAVRRDGQTLLCIYIERLVDTEDKDFVLDPLTVRSEPRGNNRSKCKKLRFAREAHTNFNGRVSRAWLVLTFVNHGL